MKLWTDFSGNESFNFLCSFLQNKSFPKKLEQKIWFVLLQLNLFLLNKHFFSQEILFSLFLCINSSLSSGRENFQTHNELWRPDWIKASNSRKCNFSSKAQELTPPPIFFTPNSTSFTSSSFKEKFLGQRVKNYFVTRWKDRTLFFSKNFTLLSRTGQLFTWKSYLSSAW